MSAFKCLTCKRKIEYTNQACNEKAPGVPEDICMDCSFGFNLELYGYMLKYKLDTKKIERAFNRNKKSITKRVKARTLNKSL